MVNLHFSKPQGTKNHIQSFPCLFHHINLVKFEYDINVIFSFVRAIYSDSDYGSVIQIKITFLY